MTKTTATAFPDHRKGDAMTILPTVTMLAQLQHELAGCRSKLVNDFHEFKPVTWHLYQDQPGELGSELIKWLVVDHFH
jgi:hypothetical protein